MKADPGATRARLGGLLVSAALLVACGDGTPAGAPGSAKATSPAARVQVPAPGPPASGSRPPAPGPHEVRAGIEGLTGPELLTVVGQFEQGAIVNVWASWCGSCKKELPMLVQVADAYAKLGVGLVTITADEPAAMPKARELLDGAGIKAHRYYLAGRVSDFKRTVDPRWKGALPVTFLIDRSGKVRYFWNGPVMADEIREVAQGFLSGEPIDGATDFTVGPG